MANMLRNMLVMPLQKRFYITGIFHLSLTLYRIHFYRRPCNEMNKRDTDNYSGAKAGESFTVSKVFDCVKRCYVDSNCQAYQIDAPNSHQLQCQLFSEVVELPSVTIALESQRIIGIKPNRPSSLHLKFLFIIKNYVFNWPRTPVKVKN